MTVYYGPAVLAFPPRAVPRLDRAAPDRALAERRPVPTSLLIRPPRLLANVLFPPVPDEESLDRRVDRVRLELELSPRVLVRPRATPASLEETEVPALTVLPIRGNRSACTCLVLVNRVLARRRRVPSAPTLADLLRVVPTPVPNDAAVRPNATEVDRPIDVMLVISSSNMVL